MSTEELTMFSTSRGTSSMSINTYKPDIAGSPKPCAVQMPHSILSAKHFALHHSALSQNTASWSPSDSGAHHWPADEFVDNPITQARAISMVEEAAASHSASQYMHSSRVACADLHACAGATLQAIELTIRHTAGFQHRIHRPCKSRQGEGWFPWAQQGSAPDHGRTQSISLGPQLRILAQMCCGQLLVPDRI